LNAGRAGYEQFTAHLAEQTCWLAVLSASEEVQERAHARGDLASCSLLLTNTLEELGEMLFLVLEEVQLPSAFLLFLFFALGVASLDCLEL